MNDTLKATIEPSSFDKIDAALAKLREVPVTGAQLLERSDTGVTAQEADRYFRAQALATDVGKLARGEAIQSLRSYQLKCGDKSETGLVAKWIAELRGMADTPSRLNEVLFALLPLGGAETVGKILTRSRTDMTAALNNAVEAKQIGAFAKSGAETLARTVDRLIILRDAINLSLAPEAHRLAQVILLADPRLSRVSALFDHALTTGGFSGIEQLRLNREEKARLDAVQKLVAACDEDVPLVTAFMAQHAGIEGKAALGRGQGRTIKPDTLIAAAVAAPAALWEQLAASLSAKARKAMSEDDLTAKKESAAQIAAKLRIAEPRMALMNQLAAAPASSFRTASTLLKQHAAFDPAKQSAESFFKDKKGVSPDQIEEVKTFQRLLKIAPAGDNQVAMASALAAAGYTSAGQIVQTGKIDFTRAMTANDGMSAIDANLIFCRARQISDLRAELQIRLSHSGVRNYEQWQGIKAQAFAADAIGVGQSSAIEPPSLAEMFGSFDICACSACQSVHSPAAFLHNLLHWMKSDVAGAWGVLEARRPDIKHLMLSCANTHTMLPYIDLANELMSARIEAIAADKYPTETQWEEPALRLQSEYRIRGAEEKLAKDYMFPLSLPFDRSAAEGKAALNAVGYCMHEAMEVFLPLNKATWTLAQTDAHLAASLGLNMKEFDFIVSPPNLSSTTDWKKYTGVSSAPGNNVSAAMKALGLEFEELKSLLALDSVRNDPASDKPLFGYETITFSDAKCSYDHATFSGGTVSNFLSAEVCLNALILLRLSRATGYGAEKLDTWLKRFAAMTGGQVIIDLEFLQFMATAQRIEKLTVVPVDETIEFVEMLAATSPQTEANIDAFVNIYRMRSNADVKLCFALFPDETLPTDGKIDALAMRIEFLQSVFASVVDTAKIPVWIAPPLAEVMVNSIISINPLPLVIKIQNALKTQMDLQKNATGAEGPLDKNVLENTIIMAVSKFLKFDASLIKQVYFNRGDTWFDIWHVKKKSLLPSAILGLEKFMQELWDAAKHIWLGEAMEACGASSNLVDAVKAIVEPVSGPNYSQIGADFVARLCKLRSLAHQFKMREDLLVGVLFEQFTAANIPDLQPAWQHLTAQFPGPIPPKPSQLVLLGHALRLQSLASATGSDIAFLAMDIFATPDTPKWSDGSLLKEEDDNAAKFTKSVAAANTDNKRITKALQDRLDEVRKDFRDALVAYTMHLHPQFDGMEDIYKELLLDPAMQPCMMTSRLVLATNSLQLLIHRAILNLETGIAPSADNKEEFEWRKNFRVWESNVKVLLYPENWIEPELRLDATPLFEAAAAALSQNELTEEHCETVLYDYLSGLDKIARLDIRAFWRDESTTPNTLHVFGRSWNAPYEYFYRRRTEGNVWTPWEKIDIDIEGDHLIPVMFHGRLWLFWPIFVEKEHRDIKIDVNGEKRGAPYVEIRMAYTTYEHGRWRGKKLLGPVLEAGGYSGPGVALNSNAKLGPTHFPIIEGSVFSDISNWAFPETHLNPLSLQYSPGGGVKFIDYSKVNLARESFFFWAKEDKNKGDLTISIRRAYSPDWETYHDGYTEMAYEDGFLIDACGTSGRLIPAAAPSNEPRIVARPYRTLPEFQNMVEGFDRPETDRPSPLYPLYAKDLFTHGPGSFPVLAKAPLAYTLTYPQTKNAMWTEPFFMADRQHTHFFERGWTCKVQNGGGGTHVFTQNPRYNVTLHEHPYVCMMIANFNRFGIDGLYAVKSDPDGLRRQAKSEKLYFKQDYDPGNLDRINAPLPKIDFDFSHGGAYSAYNWELFFHLPTLIARQLKTEGRHKEAIRWLSLIFDPTSREAFGSRRMWRMNPFMTASTETSIAAMVKLLSQGSTDPVQVKLRASVEAQIMAWQETPFEPYKIAEIRHSAYMLWCVLEYVDVLIEWGDALFRQDSMESINEATNLYMLASEILGKRPTVVEKGTKSDNRSFDELQASLKAADYTADLEALLAGYEIANGCRTQDDPCRPSAAASLFPGQYFCVPPNPKLPEYWDRVEDRLFKIRHCRNLAGEQRSLALFQPPIDPALLVRARAAGMSIEDALATMAETQLPYRFQYLLGKAQDFTAEVKALGGQLLSAIEKKDAEELSQIRQTHEINIQRATRNLKLMSLAEAREGLAALQHSLKGAETTLANYEGRTYVNVKEAESLSLTDQSDKKMEVERTTKYVASVLRVIPQFIATFPPAVETGGAAIAGIADLVAEVYGVQGSALRSQAGRASTMGTFDRRQEDWRLQIDTTRERIKELKRQVIGAEIRIQTAEKDLEVFDQQVENSKEIYDYMRSKFSNERLYGWMVGQLKTFHRGAYKLAVGMARQAQKAYKLELDAESLPDVITADHWDSSRAGLLAGEKLSFELKKLDEAYARRRGEMTIYELSRTVSLRRLDPIQLFKLRNKLPIEVVLPEWLFQTNHNGRSLKNMRMKGVSISLPCTVGPNTRVPLHVSLVGAAGLGAAGPAQKSIITSTAVADSGRFDANPNGESYLPFENEKVASTWEITLPDHLEFDPATISDLIFNIRYTAQPEGSSNGIDNDDKTNIEPAEGRFAISLRHDNYDGWLKLQQDKQVSSWAEIFPDSVISASTPYVYTPSNPAHLADAGASTDKFVIVCEGQTTLDGNLFPFKVGQNTVSLPTLSSTATGKLTFSGKVIVDVLMIRSATMPV